MIHKEQATLYFLILFLVPFSFPKSSLAQQGTNLEQLLDKVESQPGNNQAYDRQQLLRTLIGPGGSATVQKDWSSSTAYSDWQQAEDEASRAYNAAERAQYEQDKSTRQNAATEAYYAAQSARQASDRVYYASENGDPTAQEYAGKARAAADRAQAYADQARYNADRD